MGIGSCLFDSCVPLTYSHPWCVCKSMCLCKTFPCFLALYDAQTLSCIFPTKSQDHPILQRYSNPFLENDVRNHDVGSWYTCCSFEISKLTKQGNTCVCIYVCMYIFIFINTSIGIICIYMKLESILMSPMQIHYLMAHPSLLSLLLYELLLQH